MLLSQVYKYLQVIWDKQLTFMTEFFAPQGADVNQYNSGSSASTTCSILKRLLANPDEPARPEWARKTTSAGAEALASTPLPSSRQPSNSTVNAEVELIVRKRVSTF